MKQLKILVIRFSSLGDVVLSTVIFPNLKAHWPNSDVTVLTKSTYAPVFDRNPHVDHVRVFDSAQQTLSQLVREIRDQHFDVVIDLHGNLRSRMIRGFSGAARTVVVDKENWTRWKLLLFKRMSPSLYRSVRERILDCARKLGVPIVSEETQLFARGSDDLLQAHGLIPTDFLIGMAPGAQHATKRWFPSRFAEAANRLGLMANATIVLLGDKSDRAVSEKTAAIIRVPAKNITGWTTLPELIGIVSRLSFLLTNDSGLLHIAEALKIPLVALFGPTVRGFGFAPYRLTSRVVEATNLSCRPCSLHGLEACPLKHHRCMDDIDVNAVVFAASSALEEPLSSAGRSS